MTSRLSQVFTLPFHLQVTTSCGLELPQVLTLPSCRSNAKLVRDAEPFMLHLDAALAEKERRLISERTKAAGHQESERRQAW
jgi:hypothetical protein